MSSKNSTKNGKLTKKQIMDTVSSEQFRTKVSDELYEGKDLRVTKDVDFSYIFWKRSLVSSVTSVLRGTYPGLSAN